MCPSRRAFVRAGKMEAGGLPTDAFAFSRDRVAVRKNKSGKNIVLAAAEKHCIQINLQEKQLFVRQLYAKIKHILIIPGG